MSLPIPKIVLTGGPGGGKTSLLRELRREDPLGDRFILVPEAATILIEAGHLPGTKEFQLAVVELQQKLEKLCVDLARPGQMAICDRSTVDSLAYWHRLGGTAREFYERTGLDARHHYENYTGCILLRTTAVGAEDHYVQILEGARMEPAEEAAAIDRMCEQVWRDHPGFCAVENLPGGWEAKSARARECLTMPRGRVRLDSV
jgi:hypothetical protein